MTTGWMARAGVRPMLATAAAAALLLAGSLVGCDASRVPAPAAADATSGDTTVSDAVDQACNACHGGVANAAPPKALDGSTETTSRGVGAHQVHLVASAVQAAVPCKACHVVPAGVYAEGHLDAVDGKATVTIDTSWLPGNPLTMGGSWDPETATCSSVYCHGEGLKEPGKHSSPIWTQVDGVQRACDACHGAPPQYSDHPQDGACEMCHAATAGPNQTIIDVSRHIDGTVDVVLADDVKCSGCHQAPPEKNHPKLDKCHFCHGGTVDEDMKLIAGGQHMNGVSDKPGAEVYKDCGKCHGNPPQTDKHPKMNQCMACHPTTVGPLNVLLPDGKHADGQVDVQLPTACDACHGGNGSAAPPPDHNGVSDPSAPTVGAHKAHLEGDVYSTGGISCDACHVLPASVTETGHLFGTLQTVLFPAGLSSAKGAEPVYDDKNLTCSGVYCHGAKLDGGTMLQPKWTATQLDCDGCHAVPPPTTVGHPKGKAGDTSTCGNCHKKTMNPDGTVNAAGGYHINGAVD